MLGCTYVYMHPLFSGEIYPDIPVAEDPYSRIPPVRRWANMLDLVGLPVDLTFPTNAALDFCDCGAQWSNGTRYTVALGSIFWPKWSTKLNS